MILNRQSLDISLASIIIIICANRQLIFTKPGKMVGIDSSHLEGLGMVMLRRALDAAIWVIV
jgi:hypothetical protein